MQIETEQASGAMAYFLYVKRHLRRDNVEMRHLRPTTSC